MKFEIVGMIRYSVHSLMLCHKGRIFFKGGQKSSSFPLGAILPPMKIFVLSPPLKIESAPDEKNPGHASAYYYIFLRAKIQHN